MKYKKILKITNRQEFRAWLEKNSSSESECYVSVKRGRPVDDALFWYLDAVEEALCFGWIDSTIRLINGKKMQRFSPRSKKSNWTELNKERVRRLEKLGLMTDSGRTVLPEMDVRCFRIDKDVETVLKKERVWSKFKSFHPLYQRIRASNLAFYKQHYPTSYERMLKNFIEKTKQGKMYGNWSDYGRLLDY
ncbi:MAG TPA: thymidylate synthase [Salinivirgaceae bacterium]|nr:thymidylate synthase [Salinivirgaceae bacterium]